MPQTFSGLNSVNSVDVIVYPNPSSNELSISNLNAVSYEITNSIGQKVASGLVQNSKLDISKLDAASYFVHLNSDKRTVVKSFIKK